MSIIFFKCIYVPFNVIPHTMELCDNLFLKHYPKKKKKNEHSITVQHFKSSPWTHGGLQDPIRKSMR